MKKTVYLVMILLTITPFIFSSNIFDVMENSSTADLLKFIESGVDINLEDENGETPLFHLIKSPDPDLEKIDLLIANGASIKDLTYLLVPLINALASKSGDNIQLNDYRVEQDERLFTSDDFLTLYPFVYENLSILGLRSFLLPHANSNKHRTIAQIIVKALLNSKTEISYITNEVKFALVMSILSLRPNIETAKAIVTLLGDVNTKDIYGFTILDYLLDSTNQDYEIIKMIVEKGVNIAESPRFLYLAAGRSPIKIIKYLISQGSSPNHDSYDRTPLMNAVARKNNTAMKTLINAGADINVKDSDGNTAIHYAVKYCTFDEIIFLLENGADLYTRNNNGITLLHIAAENQSINVISYLVDKGLNVNTRDKDGNNCLGYAGGNTYEVVAYLISQGVNVNAKNVIGWNVLMQAASINTPEVVELLLKEGADPNAKLDNYNFTPLLFAAENTKYLENIELLLNYGADISAIGGWEKNITFTNLASKNPVIKDSIYAKSLYEVVNEGTVEEARTLLNFGMDINNNSASYESALMYDKIDFIKLFIEAGADVNKKFGSAKIPAISIGWGYEKTKLFLEAGADVTNQIVIDAFHYADYEVCSLLLDYAVNDYSIDINRSVPIDTGWDEARCNPIYWILWDCAWTDNTEIIEKAKDKLNLLINYGIKINSIVEDYFRDFKGPYLNYAVFIKAHPDMIKFLLESGADGSIKDSKGRTAFDLFDEMEHFKEYKDSELYWCLNDAQFH